jgi:putative protease
VGAELFFGSFFLVTKKKNNKKLFIKEKVIMFAHPQAKFAFTANQSRMSSYLTPYIIMATATKAKPLGKVIHFYDKIGVAIVELAKSVKVGDSVTFQRGEQEFTQTIASMQVEHKEVEKAKKGDVIGMKVDEVVKEGAVMLAS